MFSTAISNAQENYSLVFKAGAADYYTSLSFGGNSAYYTFWNDGFQISLGLEFPFNNSFSFQGDIEYSSFSFNTTYVFDDRVNKAKNQLIDLMGNIKWNLGIFYFIGGFGFSSQIGDEVKYLDENEFHDATIIYPSREKFVIAGMLGLGFDIKIYDRISMIAEADIRMREYAGTVALLGIKYSF